MGEGWFGSRALRRKRRAAVVLSAVLAGLSAACTSQLSDLGDPGNAPTHSTTSQAYPAVHDMPHPRDTKPLTPEERQKIVEELAAARERLEAETAGSILPARPPGR